MSVKNKMFKRRRSFTVFRDSATATTIANAAAAGATTVTLSSATGITNGACLRIGSGETVERHDIIGLAGAVATLAKPLVYAHDALEPAVKQVGYTIGATTGGLNVNNSLESTDVIADDQRLRYDKLPGYGTFGVSTSLLGLTPHVLAVALGIPFTAITGTGADADDPLALTTDFNDVDAEDNVSIVATHALQDGTVRTQEFWGVSADYTGLSFQLATGQPGAVPVKFDCYGTGCEYDGVPAFTATESVRATKGKLFGGFRGAGYFADATAGAAAASTLSAAADPGDTVLEVVDASDFAGQDFVMLNVDDRLEIHWLSDVDTGANTLTVKVPVKRRHEVGAAVVKQQKVRFAPVTREGVTLATSGTRTPLTDAERSMPIAFQAELVAVSLSLQVQSLTLQNRARALGIPESAIVGGRLVTTNGIGTSPINAVYTEGVLRDNTVNLLVLWGCAQDLANLAVQYGGGQATAQPFNGSPSSGMQLLQYAA